MSAVAARCAAATGCPHIAVDDFNRAAYARLPLDERKSTCTVFMGRFPCLYKDMGVRTERVMTGTGRSTAVGVQLVARITRRVLHLHEFVQLWQSGEDEGANRVIARERWYTHSHDGQVERVGVSRLASNAIIGRVVAWSRPHGACGTFCPCCASPA